MASPKREKLLADAMDLPPDERERLAHDLLDSLEDVGERGDEAWSEEIALRAHDVIAGTVTLEDGPTVHRQLRDELRSLRAPRK